VNGILTNLGLERHFNSPVLLPLHRYGISTGIQGSMKDLDGEMFWDLFVIMHELGHNFGSDHTHDIASYNPQIDACGDGQCTSLVTGNSIKSGEGTIMSYCYLCSGGGKSTVFQIMDQSIQLCFRFHLTIWNPFTVLALCITNRGKYWNDVWRSLEWKEKE
jgi:hypothetical protein